jgi:hypothetical protein
LIVIKSFIKIKHSLLKQMNAAIITDGLTNALNGIYVMREDWDGDWSIRDYTVYNGYFADLCILALNSLECSHEESTDDLALANLYALTTSRRFMDVVQGVVFDNYDLISRLYLICESNWYNAMKALDQFKTLYVKWREMRRLPEIIHWMKKSYLMCDDNLGVVMEFVGIGLTTNAEFIHLVYA